MLMSRHIAIASALAALSGCSLALDMEALQKGSDTDSDTNPDCVSQADCDDGVDCTVDSCDQDGACGHLPDNDLCEYLYYCHPQQGCVPTGDECKTNSDCDDGVDCTVDTCIIGGGDNYCLNDPDDSICESSDPCIVGEGCSTVTGCYEGEPMVCSPTTAPCMDAVCNSVSGECEDVYVAGYDDDEDGYLDDTCGGDDCDDGDEFIHPSAVEDCDGVDDDCDGYTDLTVFSDGVTVMTAASGESPALAFDGSAYAVTWQQGGAGAGEVYARFVGHTGGMISDPHNYTALGGTGAVGMSPSLAATDDGFYAVWISRAGADPARVLLVPLSVNTGTGAVSQGSLVQLDDGTANAVASPVVGWDDPASGSGWIAAWTAEWSGGDRTVELRSSDMHSMATDTFTVSTGAGETDGISLAVLGPNDYVLSYSRVDTGTDGDLEVFETRVGLDGDVWAHASGYPAMISAANPANDDDSWQTSISLDGEGGWVTAFTDTVVLGATAFTRNIEAWDGAGLTSLQQSTTYMQTDPALSWDGISFGLLYLSSVGSAVALEWRQYGEDLVPVAAPYVGTRLDLTSGAQNLREPRLVSNGAGGYAAVVIRHDGVQDNLLFYSFEGCDPTAE